MSGGFTERERAWACWRQVLNTPRRPAPGSTDTQADVDERRRELIATAIAACRAAKKTDRVLYRDVSNETLADLIDRLDEIDAEIVAAAQERERQRNAANDVTTREETGAPLTK